jgi:hypothetical protein
MTVIEKLENNIAEVNSAFQNIKSKIALHGVEVAENTRPIELAPKVNEVFEAGKKAQYDAFWDKYQQNGKKTAYNYAFAGASWNDDTFFPKYDIKPSYSIIRTFVSCAVTNLEERLQECGVALDTSDNANYSSVFEYAKTIALPEITFKKATSTTSRAFADATSLHTIRKIILEDGFNAEFTSSFTNCTALENVVFEGVIPKHITLAQSTKLSKASITSIIEHLSTTASGQTATFSKTAVNTAFETSAGTGDGSTSAEWQSLIAPKSNWTISLV